EAAHILSTGFNAVGAELSLNLSSTTYLPDERIPCVVSLIDDGEPIPEVGLNITIIANDPEDTQRSFSFEAQTDENGEYGFDVRDRIPYEELLHDEFLWFSVTAQLADDPSLVSNEGKFVVHRLMGRIATERTDYTAGEEVEIAFGEYDLVEQEWIETNYTLRVNYLRPITTEYRVSSTSIPVFVSSGVIGNEERITLSIPGHIPAGTYLITATFDNTVVEHKIQVYTRDEGIRMTSSVESYKAGDDIPIHISTSNASGKWLYVDVVTGRSLTMYSVLLDGSDLDMIIPTADYRHSVDVRAYFISDFGSIVSDFLGLRQDFSDFIVNLTLDKDTYEPGELARLNLTITDELGNPVPDLLVGLSIVDSAVFELEEDSDESPFFSRYYAPYEQERYYRLRANFAYVSWSPEELVNHTESYWPEFEEITVGNGSPEYDEERYDMKNSADGVFGMPGEATLGDDLGQALEETEIRSDFRETAYWAAGLKVENGTYSWAIKLPDNLARWRVKLLVITDTCFGAVKVIHFNTSKDFFVDVDIPHRVTQDDEFTLVTRVHNFNDDAMNIQIGLTAGPWLNVFGANEFDLTMPEMSVQEVEFRVKVLENGLHNLTLIATDFGDHIDALRKDMFVRPNGALKTIHLTGSVEDSVSEEVEFLPELVNGSEQVVLRLAVGYGGLLEEGARMLRGYPYSCTEQIMSALLPNVLLYEHYTLTGGMSWQTRNRYERNIYHGILKLLSNQHPDGGWGWWRNDQTDGFMTAYVLFGLARTRDIGLHVSDKVLEEAQDALLDRMNDEGCWAPAHWMDENHIVMGLYVSYALAVSGFDSSRLGASLNSLADAWN
ncbi:MAG: hypothetical protein KAU14_05025, partial [Thermoplasmata archaeon]|nr:hypothetical protein [Thermoplasmata archaeon]